MREGHKELEMSGASPESSGRSSGAGSGTRFLLLFSNPFIGLIGSAASLLSLTLAVYFYFQSKRDPHLTYLVSPTRTSIVKQGEASRLRVTYDSRTITRDISAVQVAIWN